MTNQWFRSWHGAPTDPKWLGIARKAGVAPGIVAALVWALLDRASQATERGSIAGYDADGLSCFMGCEAEQVDKIVALMHEKGILERDAFSGWEKHQPKREDGSAERAKEWRERKRTQANASEPEKTLDTDTDTDTDTEDKKVSCETGVPNEEKLAFEAYNDLAIEISIPKAQVLTDGRRTKIRQRLNECGGLTGWLDALGKIRGSPFLRGDNKSGWKADLDFVLQKSSFTRLLEGSYDRQIGNRATAGQHRNSIANGFAILDAVTDEAIRRAGGLGQEGSQEDPWSVPGLRQGTA